jgi:uncharacterized membrane protein
MAGIGFALRRMLEESGYSGPVKAFVYGTVISSGPWLMASMGMALLSLLGGFLPDSAEYGIFMALVVYTFAFSLIGVSVCQMIASRYLADRLFENDAAALPTPYVYLLAPLLVVQAAVGWTFLLWVPFPLPVRVATLVLFLTLNAIWLTMIFLSAAHDYKFIASTFGVGWTVALIGGVWGASQAGLFGQLVGYTAGNLVTFFLLLSRMDRAFGGGQLCLQRRGLD